MNGASVFLIAFFTAIFAATGTVFMIQRANLFPVVAPEQPVAVPSLRGLSEEDALANLRATGLVPLIAGREPTAEVKPGTVLRQTVSPGQSVTKGQPVGITLALELAVVPDVLGHGLEEATVLLEQAGYRAQKSGPSLEDKAPVGTVLKQSPPSSTPLDKGKVVLLQVSAGPQASEVPKLIGLSFGNAKAELVKSGLAMGAVRWVYIRGGGTMVVQNQDPKPGAAVKPGATVAMTVNRD